MVGAMTLQTFVVVCALIGLVMTTISALYMRGKDRDSVSLIFLFGLIGAIPAWIYTFQATSDWLLWIIGVLAGLADIVALQALADVIKNSNDWQDAVRKILGFLALVGILVVVIAFILVNLQSFFDFFTELVSEAKQYK